MFVVRGLGFLRIAQFALWGWPTLVGITEYSHVVPIAYILLAAWTFVLFRKGFRAKRMTPLLLVGDLAGAVIAAIVVSRSYPLGDAASTHNGLIAPLVGTAVTVAVYARPWMAIGGVALVTAAWIAGTWPDIGTPSKSVVFSNVAVIVVFAVVTRWNGHILMRAARQTDVATDETIKAQEYAAAAQQRAATAEARDAERRRQYAALHDNVLHTLESISLGVTDLRSDEARQNAERDAEYLRGLMTGGLVDVPTNIGAALAGMIRGRESAWGTLRVNQQYHALPADLPVDVIQAIIGVVQEALNNVAKHARVRDALVTGFGDGRGGLTVKVADEGVGFNARTAHDGLGLPWSMRDRIEQVGGTIDIDSAPGEGTSVKIEWKP